MAITAADDVFVLTDNNHLFKREGVTASCPEGVAWTKVALPKTGNLTFYVLTGYITFAEHEERVGSR